MLVIENLTIRFATTTPIEQFYVHVKAGEKCVLSGPSGRGKSTLLNAILGFVVPESGSIAVGGVLVAPDSIHAIRRSVAYIPQEVNFSQGTGKDLLLYPFSFKENKGNVPTEQLIRTTVNDLFLEYSVLLQPLHELSGGQRQRLLIASALLSGKQLFLWDEPTSALDPDSTFRVLEALAKFPEVTLISVSHDSNWTKNMQRTITL